MPTVEPEDTMLNVLSSLLSYPRDSVVFAGAGIGIPYPTSLPGGADLSNRLLWELVSDNPEACLALYGRTLVADPEPPEIILRPLVALAHSLDMAHLAGSCVRLETLLHCASSVLGESFLLCLDRLRLGTPNAYHHYLAAFLDAGGTVITTNFDTHIESCMSPRSACTIVSDFPSRDLERHRGLLVKLHGTLSTTATPQSLRSLGATLRRVMAPRSRDEGLVLNRLLSRASQLLFVGYSFSDHFDVTPVLEATRFPTAPIVIEYAPTTPEELPLTPLRSKLSTLLPSQSFRIIRGDIFPSVQAAVSRTTASPLAIAPPRVAGAAMPSFGQPERAYAICHLLVFLGYGHHAGRILAAAPGPEFLPRPKRAMIRILKADILAGERDPLSMVVLRDALSEVLDTSAPSYSDLIAASAVRLTILREMMRHLRLVEAAWGYWREMARLRTLSAGPASPEESDQLAELSLVAATYLFEVIRLMLPSPARPLLRFPVPQSKGVMPPDVAILRLRRTTLIAASPTSRLLFALETGNLLGAYLVLRDSKSVSFTREAIRLADAIGSPVSMTHSRLVYSKLALGTDSPTALLSMLGESADALNSLPRSTPRRRLEAGLRTHIAVLTYLQARARGPLRGLLSTRLLRCLAAWLPT